MKMFISIIAALFSFIANVSPCFSDAENFDQMTFQAQRSAIHDLIARSDNSSIGRLIDIVENTRYDSSVRAAAAIGLGITAYAFTALNNLRNTNYPDLRQAVLVSLCKLRPNSVKEDELMTGLNEGTNENRKLLLNCLPTAPGPELLNEVLKIIDDYPQTNFLRQTERVGDFHLRIQTCFGLPEKNRVQ